jgi:hypothetical protein
MAADAGIESRRGVDARAVDVMAGDPAQLAVARSLHAQASVLVAAEEFATRDETFAAWEMNTADRAADHIFPGGRALLRGRLGRHWLLLVFDTARPSEQEVDDDDQRNQKQELYQGGIRHGC